jgi:hypothetical protein
MLAEVNHNCEWCDVAPAIWQIVNLRQSYPWPVSQSCRDRVAALIPHDEWAAIFAVDDWALVNRNLRVTLAPHLSGPDRSHAAAVARWIVRDWGGIRRGPEETINHWSDTFGTYGDVAVSGFIEHQGTYRISSWSKLLAFADHANHAIYDARTAVALNCALAQLNDLRRFHMPASRHAQVGAARGRLLQDPNTEARGYRDYLALLRCFVVCGEGPPNLLEAEMTLFANAPRVAEMCVTQRPAVL